MTDTSTMTCPACGAEQASSRVWCAHCFAAFVEPPPLPDPQAGEAGEADAPDLAAADGTAVRLAVSELWAAQAPSRMPQILAVCVALAALAIVLFLLVARPV